MALQRIAAPQCEGIARSGLRCAITSDSKMRDGDGRLASAPLRFGGRFCGYHAMVFCARRAYPEGRRCRYTSAFARFCSEQAAAEAIEMQSHRRMVGERHINRARVYMDPKEQLRGIAIMAGIKAFAAIESPTEDLFFDFRARFGMF